MRTLIIVTILSLALIRFLPASAEIPLQINHQGVVKVNGAAFTGTGQFRFALVEPDQGINAWTNDGSALFVEGIPSSALLLQAENGLYSVDLGDTTISGMSALPEGIFIEPDLVLRVWFDDGNNGLRQLQPDHPLSSSAYSIHALFAEESLIAQTADFADDADKLDGLDSTELLSQVASSVQQLNREFVIAPSKQVVAGNAVSFVDGMAEIQSGYAPVGASPKIVFASQATTQATNLQTNSNIARLSESQVAIAYQQGDTGGTGVMVLGDIVGDTVQFGPPQIFNLGGTFYINVVAMSSDTLVVAYFNQIDNVKARVGKIADGIISFSDAQDFGFIGQNPRYLQVNPLSEEKFALTYVETNTTGTAYSYVGTVSDATIAVQTVTGPNFLKTRWLAADALSENRVVYAFGDEFSPAGVAVVGTIDFSGQTIGQEFTFTTHRYPTGLSCIALSSNRFVIAYNDNPEMEDTVSVVQVGEISGNDITFSRKYPVYGADSADLIGLDKISGDTFALSLIRETSGDKSGDWFLGKVSGTRVDFISEGVFDPGTPGVHSLGMLSPFRFLISYADEDNSEWGTARIVRPEPSQIIGIARESGVATETVPVTLFTKGAISDSHTGLQTGLDYYGQPNGSVDTNGGGVRMGVAVSETEILLDP